MTTGGPHDGTQGHGGGRWGGTFTLGADGAFAIMSTSCTLTDADITAAESAGIPCHVSAGGHVTNPQTKTAVGTVTITGNDGAITFQQTASGGCSTGTGIEIDNGRPVAIRTDGVSITGAPTGPSSFPVMGQIKVDEAGGGTIGEGFASPISRVSCR